MKKIRPKRRKVKKTANVFDMRIIILSACLFLGIVAGTFTASYIEIDSGQALFEHIKQYVSSFESIQVRDFFIKQFFKLAMYPSVIFAMGFTAFGVFVIPAIVLIKGFLLSFSVSAVVRIFGLKAVFFSFALYGLECFVLLPVMILISVYAMRWAGSFSSVLKKEKNIIFEKGYVSTFAVGIISILLLTVIQTVLLPKIIPATMGLISL